MPPSTIILIVNKSIFYKTKTTCENNLELKKEYNNVCKDFFKCLKYHKQKSSESIDNGEKINNSEEI